MKHNTWAQVLKKWTITYQHVENKHVDIITDVDIIFRVDIVEQCARKTVESFDEKWQLVILKNALSWNFKIMFREIVFMIIIRQPLFLGWTTLTIFYDYCYIYMLWLQISFLSHNKGKILSILMSFYGHVQIIMVQCIWVSKWQKA